GLSDYIQVGDNIMMEASVLGAPFNKAQVSGNTGGGMLQATTPPQPTAFLLAHVEQIEHNFEIDQETGARSFITTVRFVRGIITDNNGNLLGESGGGLLGLSFSLFGSSLSSSNAKTSA